MKERDNPRYQGSLWRIHPRYPKTLFGYSYSLTNDIMLQIMPIIVPTCTVT